MASSVQTTRLLWLACCVFSAATVHSYFYNRTDYAVLEQASGSAGLVGQASSIAEVVKDKHAGGASLDVYVGTAFNNTYSPARANPRDMVALLDGLSSVMADGRLNTEALAIAQDALPDETRRERGTVDGTTLSQLGGLTEAVPEDNQAQIIGVRRLSSSPRPRARSEVVGRKVTSTQVPMIDTHTALAVPGVSKRPLARPVGLNNRPPSVQQPEDLAVVPLLQPVVTQAAVPVPRPKVAETIMPAAPGRDMSGMRLGTILGVFETGSRRWALVQGEAGAINLLEPGDTIGAGIVSSINNGTLVVSVGAAFKEYSAGDRL